MSDNFYSARISFLKDKFKMPAGKLQLANSREEFREEQLSEVIRQREVDEQKNYKLALGLTERRKVNGNRIENEITAHT